MMVSFPYAINVYHGWFGGAAMDIPIGSIGTWMGTLTKWEPSLIMAYANCPHLVALVGIASPEPWKVFG